MNGWKTEFNFPRAIWIPIAASGVLLFLLPGFYAPMAARSNYGLGGIVLTVLAMVLTLLPAGAAVRPLWRGLIKWLCFIFCAHWFVVTLSTYFVSHYQGTM